MQFSKQGLVKPEGKLFSFKLCTDIDRLGTFSKTSKAKGSNMIRCEDSDIVLVPDGNGNMVDPSFITRKYLGVTYHKRNKKWIAQASEHGRSKYLGCFKTPERAARVYDAYVVEKGGANVKTNFPISEVDTSLKPIVKRYRKRTSADIMRGVAGIQQIATDPWETYMTGIFPQCSAPPKRKIKDPLAPKGPRNAYMMYISKNREIIQKEVRIKPLAEGNSFGAISRELGRRWKALKADEKKEYEDLAAADKIRSAREKKEYQEKIKKENEEQHELYASNVGLMKQYAQTLQSQWLQMMGYGGAPPQFLNQTLQSPDMSPSLCTQSDDVKTDMSNTSGYPNHPWVTNYTIDPSNCLTNYNCEMQNYFNRLNDDQTTESLGYVQDESLELQQAYYTQEMGNYQTVYGQ